MDISVSAHDDSRGRTIVTVTGNLNAATVKELQENLVRLIVADSFYLVVDLSAAQPLDAAAVEPVLVDAASRVERYRGWVHVVDPSGTLKTLGAVAKSTAPLAIYTSLSQALPA